MLSFWASILLDIVGCATVIFLIATTVRMDLRERIRFFSGPKRKWAWYLAIVSATLGWSGVLVSSREGHRGWHIFAIVVMLVVFGHILVMWVKVRRAMRQE